VARKVRIGVIGAGSIGGELYRRLVGAADLGLEPAFIWTRDARRLPDDVRPAHRIADLDPGSLRAARPDLVVEAASPEITVRHGAAILALADYLPLSVTALVDDPLRATLEAVAGRHGHRLLIPTGALVGASALAAVGPSWRRPHIASVPSSMMDPCDRSQRDSLAMSMRWSQAPWSRSVSTAPGPSWSLTRPGRTSCWV